MINWLRECWERVPNGWKMIQAFLIFVLAIIYVDFRWGQRKNRKP